MTRRGFTLIELLVAVVVAGILGVALTRLLVNDSRFVERQDAMLSSRRTSRTAMNWVVTELRMVSNGGLVGAAPDSVTVRVPFAFVMTCGRVGGLQIMSRLPVDSLSYAPQQGFRALPTELPQSRGESGAQQHRAGGRHVPWARRLHGRSLPPL